MKKTLLALALTGAFASGAFAQNVTLSGLVDAYVGSIQYSGDKRVLALNSGGMTTSWWGISGTEDLGGGLKASFKLSSFFRVDSGSSGRFPGNESFFSRDASVALEGGFGKVTMGRALAPNFLPTVIFNSFGDSFAFSPLVVHANVPLFNGTGWPSANAGDTGWSNEIIYSTPNFSGFSANLHYQLGEVSGSSGKRNFGGNFLYFGGPFAVGGFVHSVRVNNPLPGTAGDVKLGFSQQKAWMLSGKAGLGPANVFANYERTSHDGGIAGDADSKIWSVSADLAAGSGKVLAAYANTKWTTTPITSTLNGKKRKTFSLGYDYVMSKRTDVYTVVMSDKITNANKGTTFALGMRHKF
jgi:predicted porin